MKTAVRLWLFLTPLVLGGCSQQSPVSQAPPADALTATRRYNDYLEKSLVTLESLATDPERRNFASGLRSSLESETTLFRNELRSQTKSGTLQTLSATAEYKAEVARLGKLSQRFTVALEKYVTH